MVRAIRSNPQTAVHPLPTKLALRTESLTSLLPSLVWLDCFSIKRNPIRVSHPVRSTSAPLRAGITSVLIRPLTRFIREAVTDGDVRAHASLRATDFTRGAAADEADAPREGTEHRKRS